MDWGNAFVRSKTTDANGVVTSIEMELHLDGDFRKTKKKVTWLAQPAEHKLVDTVLLDYDYIITKKKLEEDDKVEDFVTPVTEFREEAYTDANVIELKQGDIIQFERKGYYVFDGIVDGVREFIRIPDGRAAGLASKAVTEPNKGKYDQAASATAQPALTAATAEYPTTMYEVTPVYGDSTAIPPTETSMYKVKNVYDV
jgi:glutamyl-tRNA synthetase